MKKLIKETIKEVSVLTAYVIDDTRKAFRYYGNDKHQNRLKRLRKRRIRKWVN